MRHVLHIRIRKAEGCLVRLLGLVQRRGYDVRDVTARLAADEKAFDVILTVRPILPANRPLDVLLRMVDKLYDVESARLEEVVDARPGGAEPSNGSDEAAVAKKAAGKKP